MNNGKLCGLPADGPFCRMLNLTDLDLSNNQLEARCGACRRGSHRKPSGLEQCCRVLAGLPKLCRLDLSNNQLRTIPDQISQLVGVQAYCPVALRWLTGVKVLDLSHNQVEQLPVALGRMKALYVLDYNGARTPWPTNLIVIDTGNSHLSWPPSSVLQQVR